MSACRSAFERRSRLNPLPNAFEAAKAEFREALSPNTERKLTKVIINLARKEIKAGNQLVAQALAKEAVEFISQLRSAQWLA